MSEHNAPFGGERAEQYNALWSALHKCALDEEMSPQEWKRQTPRTTLVVFLVDELHRAGFEIKEATT